MKILVACECSGKVRDAFIKKGHDAISCDLKASDRPGPHYMGDVTDFLYDDWDMVIAFPPCTHLASSGAAHFKKKQEDGRQRDGIEFFLKFTQIPCRRVVIENPVGVMSKLYRKPDQIIQPYYFGHEASKKTCLWLKNMRKLRPTNIVSSGEWIQYESGRRMPKWYADAYRLPPEERSTVRSELFQGIADAMGEQWGDERRLPPFRKEYIRNSMF